MNVNQQCSGTKGRSGLDVFFVEIFRYRLATLIAVISIIVGIYLAANGLPIVGIGLVIISLVSIQIQITHQETERAKPWPPIVNPCPNLFARLENGSVDTVTCISLQPETVFSKDGQTTFSYPVNEMKTTGCNKARQMGLDWDGC